MIIDLRQFDFSNGGLRYEDTYGKYLDIFRSVAEADPLVQVDVQGPPWSWVPLLMYLGAGVHQPQMVFELCPLVAHLPPVRWDRTAVEVLCGVRPECVDALWKCDMEWKTERVRDEGRKEFVVTTNGAYHRAEVLEFMDHLDHYQPSRKRCVLVPCAADKPYPAPLHQKVLNILPDDYELIIATGVLGLVPQGLWDVMPHYDSGIPNQWRLFVRARDFFNKHHFDHVIAYTDFYSLTIARALEPFTDTRLSFVDPPIERAGYLDLMDTRRLAALRALFIGPEVPAKCWAKQRGAVASCVCGVTWEPAQEKKPECRRLGDGV